MIIESQAFQAVVRGDRFYVRGAEVYSAIEAWLLKSYGRKANIDSLSLRFVTFFDRSGELVFFTGDEPSIVSRSPFVCTISGDFPVGSTIYAAYSMGGLAIKGGNPLHEDALVENTVISGRSATVLIPYAVEVIDGIVAATKTLHNSLYTPAPGEKWILSGLDISCLLGVGTKSIEVNDTVVRSNMTHSCISIDGVKLGSVVFHRIAEPL